MTMILISVTQKGNEIGLKLRKPFPKLEIKTRNQVVELGLKEITKHAFIGHDTLIFVASTGVAVRAIAPLVKDKKKDPAVLVIDSEGKYVISLLSGHLGGANKMTKYLASYLKAIPIITTATDQLGIVAPDIISKNNNLIIENMDKCKNISVKLIEGEKVGFVDQEGLISLPQGYVAINQEPKYQVVVSNQKNIPKADLQLIRKNIILGIGCRKNTDPMKMRNYVLKQLERLNIHPKAVSEIVSIDIKKNEACMVELAKYLEVPFKLYTKDEISRVMEPFEGSEFVEKQVGVKGVCEPCVLLSGAQIIQGKSKFEGMTLCIGKKEGNNGKTICYRNRARGH